MRDEIAQEQYGKKFDELSTNEQKGVGGGLKGGMMADPERAPDPPEVKFGENFEE